MYSNLAIMAAFVFVYSIISGRVDKMALSGPIVFTLFGVAFGPLGLDLLSFHVDGEELKSLAELTLALVLFTDSANADLATLRRSFRIPQRMLLIGLPLTIAFGFGVGRLLFPDLPLLTVAILATMLAPTDAALGQAVVTNQAVPAPTREGLNVRAASTTASACPSSSPFSPSPPAPTGAAPGSRFASSRKKSASGSSWASD